MTKTFCIALLIISFLLIVVLFIQMPARIEIDPNSVIVSTITINNEDFLSFSSDPVNAIGDLQGAGFELDQENRRILLTYYVIRNTIFPRIAAHNDWPLAVRERVFLSGKYDVMVWHGGTYVKSTSFNVK